METKQENPALPLERAVLGAILIEKGAIHEVANILKTPKVFSEPRHQIVYSTILALLEEGQPIDMLTATEKLRSQGRLKEIGGAYFVTTLTNSVMGSANIQYYARIVSQYHIKREYAKHALSLHEIATDETTDITAMLDYSQNFNNHISSYFHASDSSLIEDVSKTFFENLELKMSKGEGLAGYPTGFKGLDEITLGMEKGSFIIVAARPGEGKTVLGSNIATNVAANENAPVAIFSLEMAAGQLLSRMVSADTQVPHEKIKTGHLSRYDLQKIRDSKIYKLPIYIYDHSNLTINELRAHAIRLYFEKGVRLIVVDYLQLMQGTRKNGGTREEEVSSISRGLKILARELNIPIIAMAQLSREPMRRAGTYTPRLSDLRESGALEQDADVVIFIHRPEIHGFETFMDGSPTQGKAIIMVAKHRHGNIGEVPLDFKGCYYQFRDAT